MEEGLVALNMLLGGELMWEEGKRRGLYYHN